MRGLLIFNGGRKNSFRLATAADLLLFSVLREELLYLDRPRPQGF